MTDTVVVAKATDRVTTNMKLGEFYDNLTRWIERESHDPLQQWRDLEVAVPLANHSVGPSAANPVSWMNQGMDWNHNTFFLGTETKVYKAYPVTPSEFLESMKTKAEMLEKLWPNKAWLPKNRVECWKEGYREGFRYGMHTQMVPETELVKELQSSLPSAST